MLESEDDGETVIEVIPTGPWDECFRKGVDEHGRPYPIGIVKGSVVLLGGEPGAGKSTVALQLAGRIAEVTEKEILYVAAEESKAQVLDRARRLKVPRRDLFRLIPKNSVGVDMGEVFLRYRPGGVVIDSLTALAPDIQDAANICKNMKDYATELNAPFVVIDQVTKDRDFAGLMSLQHCVDTLLMLVKSNEDAIRAIQSHKNRFGESNFEKLLRMTGLGLVDYVPEEDEDE